MFCSSKHIKFNVNKSNNLNCLFLLVSGEVPQEPVVSRKSGALFEKRLISKYIQEEGKCPVTGEDLEEDDLIVVKGSSLLKIVVLHRNFVLNNLCCSY